MSVRWFIYDDIEEIKEDIVYEPKVSMDNYGELIALDINNKNIEQFFKIVN